MLFRSNLTSRSSLRLQRLEQGMLGASQQCQVVREPCTVFPQGWVRGLGTGEAGSVLHHPPSASLSQHYGQLQNLLEQRALLLFLHSLPVSPQRNTATNHPLSTHLPSLHIHTNTHLSLHMHTLVSPNTHIHTPSFPPQPIPQSLHHPLFLPPPRPPLPDRKSVV